MNARCPTCGAQKVYRADDLKLGQPVALRFLPRDVETDPDRLERLLTEVRRSLRVTHPNGFTRVAATDASARRRLSPVRHESVRHTARRGALTSSSDRGFGLSIDAGRGRCRTRTLTRMDGL